MTMAMVAAGIAAAGSLYSANRAASGAAKQGQRASDAENKAIAKANMSQIVRNNYRGGLLQMQKGLQKKQAVQQGFDTTVMAQQAMGQSHANAAASGTVGASSEAVANDIRMKLGEAQAQQKDQYEAMLTNYNTELDSIRMNALESTVEARKYEYTGPSSGQMFGSALAAGAMAAGSAYAGQQMKLGLGTPPADVGVQNTTMRGLNNAFGPSPSGLGSGTYKIWRG